jgi:Tol biopolymer transport system component
MGEVYRARDDRLKRDVAIKVLPAAVSSDPDRLRRFQVEAQAAGGLNHPNLAAVHDVGQHDDAPYVVQELLEGETLRSLLAGGRLSPRRTIGYALQIARGLAAAHAKGIVHRDLKPENLFVTSDGRVKILDFGLAKLTHQEEATQVTNLPTAPAGTEPGVVLGTLGYMSPEQVKGRPADARSDIFSLGAILYEMLSGNRAFRGDSTAETMSAILKEDPPELSVTNQNVSPGLERIVRHCLEKSPESRFHSAHDVAFDLEALSGTSGTAVPLARRARVASRPVLMTLAGAALLLIGIAIGRLTVGAPPEPPEIRPLTTSGHDSEPSAAPDGKTVAFRSDRDGRIRIWVKQIVDGSEVALTSGPADSRPHFSPDGSSILFARATGPDAALYRVAIVGGDPRKLLADAYDGDWSPDGRTLAFLRERRGEALQLGVAGSDGSSPRILSTFRNNGPADVALPRWTPDGKALVVVELAGQSHSAAHFLRVSIDGKEEILRPPNPRGDLSSLCWSRGAMIYMQGAASTSETRSVSGQVLRQVPGARSGRVLLNVPSFGSSLNVLGERRLVFDSRIRRMSMREVSTAPGGSARRIARSQSTDRQPAYSPDGRRIVFASDRAGNFDVWELVLESGAVRRLTDDPGEDWDPALSPDGKHLLWSSDRSGHFEIFMADADGSGAHQVTRDGLDAENPTMTADGSIVYASPAPGARQGLWKIRADGSGDTKLQPGPVVHPEVSPDGRYVLYFVSGEARICRVSDGQRLPFRVDLASIHTLPGRGRWTPDGKRIVLLGALTEDGPSGVFVQDFSVEAADTSASRRPLAGFEPEHGTDSFGVSPDGSHIAIAEIDERSDIFIATGVPEVFKTFRTR